VLDDLTSFYRGKLHCHFSCIEFTGQGERRHLPLSAMQPDYRPLVKLLRQRGTEATLISETPPPEDGAKQMLRLLRAKL